MAEPQTSSRRPKSPWALTFFGLLAIAGLIAMPLLAGTPDPDKMPDMVRFLGRFHPVLLHLPIGVFALILIQELSAIFAKRSSESRDTPAFPMFFGAASAILAVIAGFLLYQGEDYGDSEVVTRHLWAGLIFAVIAVFTFMVKAWTVARAGNPAFYRLLLFGSVGIMGFASHDGASITHGDGYLTQYAPDPVRKAIGLKAKESKSEAPAKPPAEQLVYADIVAPILERRCVQCHKEGKAKGKLRMDTFEMLVKGGKEGPAFEPGDAAKSNIIVRIDLPMDDEEHMPPEGKTDIEDHEVAVLKWWIDQGGDDKLVLGGLEIPAPIQEAIAKLLPAAKAGAAVDSDTAVAEVKPAGPDEALKYSVAAFAKEFPGALSFESQQSSGLTFTAVSLRGNLDDTGFNKLEKLLPHLVTIDLSATKITDQSVAKLTSAGQLRMIRLAETGITDASMDLLLKIPSLESINLYGTKVTDAGVSKLGAMPNLKRLYLWQTAVTPEATKALKEKLPSCEIVTGIDA
ncbi:MAG: c-type cytochrome domain-containing protein [Akkermansiaceae bacterium]